MLMFNDQNKIIEYNKQVIDVVNKICTPLNIINADSFTYLRFYKDGNVMRIGSNLEYNNFMIENSAVNTYQYIIDRIAKGEKVTLPFSPTNIVASALKHCGIKSIFSSFYHKENYIEGYGVFSSRNDIDFTPSFVSNIQLIERFIVYFNNIAKDIIDNAEENKIFFKSTLQTNNIDRVYQLEKIEAFLKATELEIWEMKINPKLTVKLTRAEVKCLTYLVYGYSYKIIADNLAMAPRTVEKHMENIRNKTGLHNKQKLLETFVNSDLYILSPVYKPLA